MPRDAKQPEGTPTIDHRLARFWADPSMFATSLLCLFIESYGTEGLSWSPETVEMEVRDDFGVDLPAASFDRLMTGVSLLTTNAFFRSPPDFARACYVLAGHAAPEGVAVMPDCADVAWGVTEALLISPPDGKDEEPFDAEVLALVGLLLDEEGIVNAPDVLRMGLRDKQPAAHYGFSDDPEMFAAVDKFEGEKTAGINRLVKGRAAALFRQLQSLPVGGGRAAQVAGRLLSRLPDADEALPLPG